MNTKRKKNIISFYFVDFSHFQFLILTFSWFIYDILSVALFFKNHNIMKKHGS